MKGKKSAKSSEEGVSTDSTDQMSKDPGKKFKWTDDIQKDLFDIILPSDLMKRKLLLENMGQATSHYYESVALGLKLRIEQYDLLNPTFPSARKCRTKVKNIKAFDHSG